MATKVKGDKIKEGSIPLNALSTEVKDKIENAGGGADWNAQEGEAGHIKNKPFYDNINNKFDINDFEERIETEEEFGETYTYSVYTTTIYNFDGYNLAIKIKDSEDYGYYFIDYKEEKDIFTLGSTMTIKPSSDNEEIIIEIIDPTNFQNYLDSVSYKLYEKHFNNGYIKHINGAFIPDTVIKTTPQSLSNTAKNQALANLGIDPVVWKYLCNPYRAWDMQPIPEDLHNIIIDTNFNSFKPIIKNVLIIENDAVGNIPERGYNIETFNGLKVTYNFDERKFVI